MPHLHQYTREKLLALARDLAKTYGESLTLTAFRRETGLSQHLIFDLCGSWCQLRTDIGLTPEAPRARNKLSTEKIRDQLRAAIEQHGTNLSETRFCQLTGLSGAMLSRRFGSWGQLRESIGLAPRAVITQRYTDQQLMDDLFNVIAICRIFPPYHQYKRLGGKISAITLRDRFGSWPLTKDAFEDYMTQRFPRCGPCRYYERAEDRWKPSTTTPPNDSPPRTP